MRMGDMREKCPCCEFEAISGRYRFRLNSTGEVLEVDALVMDAEEWMRRPQSKDPAWRSLDYGSLILAVKVMV
jgi:hypothetical protein